MALFLSTHINKIDKKGRVSVPSSFRAYVKESEPLIVLPAWQETYLFGGDYSYFQALNQKVQDNASQDPLIQDLGSAIFSKALALHLDPEGRVILPAAFLAHASIDTQVAFVGRGESFELWNPLLWEKEQENLNARMAGTTLKQALTSIRRSHA